ncbi:MAG: creatininase family protein, partial [Armatimonadota bacterium]|nr:creatininase family protein [Armatimonadota bacterium]
KAIQEVVSEFNANQKAAIAWAFPDYEPTMNEGFPGDHAGPAETSYMLYYHPELVDLSKLPDRELSTKVDGIMGDPRTASSKRGRDQANVFVKNTIPKIMTLLSEIRWANFS